MKRNVCNPRTEHKEYTIDMGVVDGGRKPSSHLWTWTQRVGRKQPPSLRTVDTYVKVEGRRDGDEDVSIYVRRSERNVPGKVCTVTTP